VGHDASVCRPPLLVNVSDRSVGAKIERVVDIDEGAEVDGRCVLAKNISEALYGLWCHGFILLIRLPGAGAKGKVVIVWGGIRGWTRGDGPLNRGLWEATTGVIGGDHADLCCLSYEEGLFALGSRSHLKLWTPKLFDLKAMGVLFLDEVTIDGKVNRSASEVDGLG
jgi:hypothetical protein